MLSERTADLEKSETRVHLPGEAGIWIFILGDMSVFGLFFATFMFYRGENPALYTSSQALLNQNWGAINTLVLLLSSLFVVIALNAWRAGRITLSRRLLVAALICGLAFVGVKYFEWGEKLRAGISITTDEFFMYYFVFTGIHLLHLVIGLGVLGFLIGLTRRPCAGAKDTMLMEGGACYWHMVDLLWIVLFPILYLVK